MFTPNHFLDLDQVLAILRRNLANSDRSTILKDLMHAPAWIAEILRRLTEPTSAK